MIKSESKTLRVFFFINNHLLWKFRAKNKILESIREEAVERVSIKELNL